LRAPDLLIRDESRENIDNHGAEGHVLTVLTVALGPIHTRFDLGLENTTFNLIHEGTHLFASTNDTPGYIRGSYGGWMAVWNATGGDLATSDNMQSPVKGINLKNADSYAVAAFALSGRALNF
jgi:hypothetical protein